MHKEDDADVGEKRERQPFQEINVAVVGHEKLQQQRGEIKNNRVFTQTRKDVARVMHRLTQLEEQD